VLRRIIIVLIIALFAAGELAPTLAFAQDASQDQPAPKRKSIFDFLFGGGQADQQVPPPVVKAPVIVKPKKGTLPAPAKPAVQKSATAVRLAVFGDIMASDLAAALDRYYTNDPNIVVINQGVDQSGFARPDFFDWNKTAADQIQKGSFDIAVMFVGTNDRQSIKSDAGSVKVLTSPWSDTYKSRVAQFVQVMRAANKPIIWVGMPAVQKPDLSAVLSQIGAIQQLAVFAGGGGYVDIYDRFVDDNGDYSATGPDLNGNQISIRRSDGIRFTSAGADKLAYYVSQTIKLYYRGGSVGVEVADALAGTDAALMVRPPYQGLGQTRLLEVAGAVIPLSLSAKPATDLVTSATAPASGAFDMTQLIDAPQGRVDDFGVGKAPKEPADAGKPVPVAAAAPAETPVASGQ
jgi:uncharacterized protein